MPGSRRLPTRGELRIWREFIETTEALRTVLAGGQPDDGEAVAALERDGLLRVHDGVAALPSAP